MHAEKTLGRSSRFEALHLALSSSYHLVRVLGPIVLAKLLFMVARQPDVVEGGAVGAQLIGYHHLWREALFSQQLANQSCTPVSPALNQHIADLAPHGRPPATDASSEQRRSRRPTLALPTVFLDPIEK